MTAKEKAFEIVKAANSKKALDIELLAVEGITSMTDYFVICTGNSSPQIKAISEEIQDKMTQQGIEPLHIEGYNDSTWVLLDYDDVVVHIFHNEARGFYSLERLWADSPRVDIDHIIKN